MNTPRRAAIVLAIGLGVLGAATPARAATTPDPTLTSPPSTTAWFGPALAQKAYCEANRGDLMLPGRAGYEHCMQYGY